MSKKIRCAIYDRVSTDLQVQTGLSLDTQKTLLTEYAISHGYEVVGYYADEGITARKKLQNRKDFMRLLDDVEKDKIDLILVTKLDRWFRNVKDYHNTQAILEEHHCNWKTILEDYDTTTADGQLKINIMLAVAQNESDRTSERIKVVFDFKKRNQEHLNGPVPFGYVNIDKHLQKDPAKKHIVEDIFRYYLSCYSKRKTIAHTLETYGKDSPTQYQINYMLKSEIYAGMRYGTDGYCEPYISKEQYFIICKVCSSKTYPHTKQPYLFSQLIKCPYCGRNMTGFVKRKKLKNGTFSEYKRYRCYTKYKEHTSGACITESVIEDYMLENAYPELDKCLYEIKSREKTAAVSKDNRPKIRAEMERLNILFQKSRISIDYYDQEYSRLEKELETENEKEIITVDSFNRVKERLSGNWKDIYEKLDYEHRKIFWKSIISEIYVDRDTHKICGFKFLTEGCSKK